MLCEELNMNAKLLPKSGFAKYRFRILCAFAILGAICLLTLLGGCSSLADSQGPDPTKYNAETGYPAIGGPTWGDKF